MKTMKQITILIGLLISFGCITGASPLGTAFTYQGQLQATNGPLNGDYNLQFSLWDGPGSSALQVCGTQYVTAGVTNGLFTVLLDFGADGHAFEGAARWLQIAVQAGTNVATLSPRQPLTPTPYALFAPSAGSLSSNANQTFTGTVSF
ncbi:MAG: hypothetical protein NT154_17160, partial [Verrucomicrobia bacterium]|nr:hypothetical protein [Verrucomicrobiota bacterium]